MTEEIIDSRFLQTCDVAFEEFVVEPFTMVIFGGAGDLSRRKLIPTLFHLYREKELPEGFSVIGFGRHGADDEQYRAMMEAAVREFGDQPFDETLWDEFERHLFFQRGSFEEDESYRNLREKVERISVPASGGKRSVIYYLAVSPHVTPLTVQKLNYHNLCSGPFDAKIIIEKPFGRDRASAADLNRIMTDAFQEDRIYRIDHYLGKDPVQNIIFFRFSNAVFDQFWNRLYVDNVQITVAEDIGIEHRGGFYEQTGVVRDIVQNHMLQILGFIAMEPPVGFKADFIRDEKVKVLRSIRPMDARYIDAFAVRGQYGEGRIRGKDVRGYREEEGVSSFSHTPTFFAAKMYIDNPRWAGVPFYIRTGKRLPRQITDICIQFRRLPLRLFGRTCDVMQPNVLSLTIQPGEEISLRFNVKYPRAANQIYSASMAFNYFEAFRAARHPAYERLLIDCIKGDFTLFVRQDSVEAMWEVVDPIIARWEGLEEADFPIYAAGSWGPAEAHLLLEREGRYWITD